MIDDILGGGLETPIIVVMGVSAAGKSSVGRALADRLGLQFRDADDLHPAENIAKMASGIPLSDEDRWPWLERVGQVLAQASPRSPSVNPAGIVVACSALKRAYRDVLRRHSPDCIFVHLTAPREVLEARLASRAGHFMPTTLLDSQLATLETLSLAEAGCVIDVSPGINRIVDDVIAALSTLRRA